MEEKIIDNYIREFISELKFVKGTAESSLREYKKILNLYKPLAVENGINKFSFLNFLEKNSTLAKNTIKLRTIVIKSFLNYLFENGYISGNNYWKQAITKSSTEVPKGMTEKQVEIFFSVIKNNRDYIFFDLLIKMGLRISEALSLKRKNLIFHTEYCEMIVIGKGNKERILKISKEYAESLLFNNTDYLFSKTINEKEVVPTSRTIQRKFKNYADKANELIKKLNKKGGNINFIEATPHALRHTCAKRLLNNGKNIEEVRYILGHTNISTTGIYLRSEHHSSLLDKI
jgi:integrase/recombinase XerD